MSRQVFWWACWSYLALAITTLHLQVTFLSTLPLELSLLAICAVATVAHRGLAAVDFERWPLLLFFAALILLPLVSSIVNHQNLWVFQDGEYRTWSKMIVMAGLMTMMLEKSEPELEQTLKVVLLSYTGLALIVLVRYFWMQEMREFDGRPELNLRHGDANFLASFFAYTTPWWLAPLQTKIKRPWSWIGGALFLVVLAVLQSRAVVFAFLLGLIPFLYHQERKNQIKVFLGGLIVVFGLLAFGTGERLGEIADKSNQDRLKSWSNGVTLMMEKPILGVGMHQAVHSHYHNTGHPHFQSLEHPLDIHNTFLKLGAELGLVMLFATLGLMGWIGWRLTHREQGQVMISSWLVMMTTLMSVGLAYKDLWILHVALLANHCYRNKT